MLLDKLEQTWAYYLSYNSKARMENRTLLSSELGNPAPGRRILIIRSDNRQASPNTPFISFDRLTNSTSTLNGGGFQTHGLIKLDSNGLPPDAQSAPKRKWNLLKSVFGGTANPKPGEVTPPGSVSDENEINPIEGLMSEDSTTPSNNSSPEDGGNQGDEDAESLHDDEMETPRPPYTFKFSLENQLWNASAKTRPLYSPSLPRKTLHYIQHQRSAKALTNHPTEDSASIDESKVESRDTDTSTASTINSYATTKTSSVDEADFDDSSSSKVLRNERVVASKYAGRALAEWAQVVCECDNFFERRRNEGVPSDELVETPSLSVETFRK